MDIGNQSNIAMRRNQKNSFLKDVASGKTTAQSIRQQAASTGEDLSLLSLEEVRQLSDFRKRAQIDSLCGNPMVNFTDEQLTAFIRIQVKLYGLPDEADPLYPIMMECLNS
jgi:hypothetical protein